MTTPPEHRRATRSSTTGDEGRFPHTAESAKDLEAIVVELKRRGEPATAAAACRFALAFTRGHLNAGSGELLAEALYSTRISTNADGPCWCPVPVQYLGHSAICAVRRDAYRTVRRVR